MSDSYLWGIIVVVTLANFFMRTVFVEAYGKIKYPLLVERGLRYVPAAVLAAIIAPAVLAPSGQWVPLLDNAMLWAAMVSGLVAWYFSSIFRTLLVGILLYWALLWLGMS